MTDRTYSFEVNRTSTAPPEVLFRLETDGARWSEWAKPLILQSSWARRADSAPGEVGAIRAVGLWPLLLREETLEYEQDRRHVYAFAGQPAPAKNYRAEVFFTPNATGGTNLRWTGSFTEALPGTGQSVLLMMRTAIRIISAQLVKAAESSTRK